MEALANSSKCSVGTVLKVHMRDMDVVMHRREMAMERNQHQMKAEAAGPGSIETAVGRAHVARVARRAACTSRGLTCRR